ncbi:MAG: tocopherol cyclase family protein [Eubacteriaceae bacterium]
MNFIKKIYYPEIFQGKYKKKNYFEGWYFKNIDKAKNNALAVIPGISYSKSKNECHCFIQILDSIKDKTYYIKFDLNEFKYNENYFEIEIGNNYFSAKQMSIDICNDDIFLKGVLKFDNVIQLEKTILRPGIMGPFSYIPFMECYHAIVNIHHEISGQIEFNGDNIDFNNGYGYIEKDWGTSFPKAWIWLQSNHFYKDNASVMFSIAKIPFMKRRFSGFISFLRVKGEIYYFATYTNAKIRKLYIHNNKLEIIINDKDYIFELYAENSSGGLLKAPQKGEMVREIYESIDAKVRVVLKDKKGNLLFEGEGTNAGMEVMCDNDDFSVS